MITAEVQHADHRHWRWARVRWAGAGVPRHLESDVWASGEVCAALWRCGRADHEAVQAFRADVRSHQYPSDEESYHLPKETKAGLDTVLARKRAMGR